MNKTAVIHQPDFLPYMGFFQRFLNSDLWIILDNVQFLNNSKSWHNRDKIKTENGEKWFTVAVQKCSQKTPINEVLLSDTGWREDNLNLIINNYRKAPFFNEIIPYINNLYAFQCEKMIDFNLKSIDTLMEIFNIKIERIMASNLHPEGNKNDLLIDLLKKVDAKIYLSGVGAKNYLIPELFEEAGIQVIWQDFKHPVYPQLHGEFIPYLSSIDMLFNCGIEKSREILRSC
ncbi:MAG TPA: WbqC family protein [Candidatus Gastranaerophilales bacterium]|nr:WbqC family protein [Candidatus Gastranaerophilales bacterium]